MCKCMAIHLTSAFLPADNATERATAVWGNHSHGSDKEHPYCTGF